MTSRHAPPRVSDRYEYWIEEPPEQSDRATYWIKRFAAGWRPGRRIARLGYDFSAEFYGVYIWEYCNVLAPMLRELEK